jgi:CPA1 family monovalent cation:H+ antiporter
VGLKTSDFLVDLNANNSTFWLAIVSAIALAIITRGVVIFLLIPLVNRFQPSNPINWRFQLVTIWGGLRGAIALALALSLSNDFPHRQLIVAMTLGVAVFTILVSGSTIGRLVRWLGLDQLSKREELARVQARVFIQKETLELSKELEKRPFFEQSIVDELKQDYEQNLQQAEASAAKFWEKLRADPVQMRQVFWLQVVQIEHHAYRELHDEGVISELALKKLSVMMNWKGDAVLSNQIPPPIAKTRTLETPLRKLIVNRLLLLIPKRYWLANRRIKELAFRYEYYAAIMYVSKKVVKIIKQLAHQQAVDEDVASQCIEFYEKNGDAALNWINTFVEDHPELAFPMQKQVIKRATLRRQSETLDSLADRGIIPEKDLENLREQLLEKKPNL